MFRATLHDTDRGRVIYKVGALERLLERSSKMVDCRGEIIAINNEDSIGDFAACDFTYNLYKFLFLHAG